MASSRCSSSSRNEGRVDRRAEVPQHAVASAHDTAAMKGASIDAPKLVLAYVVLDVEYAAMKGASIDAPKVARFSGLAHDRGAAMKGASIDAPKVAQAVVDP